MLRAHFADQVVSFPTTWSEVTLRQVLAIGTSSSVIFALASNPDLLRRLPDPNADETILPHLQFIANIPDFSAMPVADRLTITIDEDGKPVERRIKRPMDIGLETYGQKITLDEELRRLQGADRYNYIDAALALLSVYLYPQLSGKPFNDIIDAEPYRSAILDLPCPIALPLAAFFLQKSTGSIPSGRITYEQVATELMIPSRWRLRPGRWFRNWRSTKATNRRTPLPSTANSSTKKSGS
ncbi:hypothetical protein [uncultured Fibrella sp.]|uniref:hypothetical protein n=1 Tax=uncultured Fibrella sp. TaxID=1284596 RepID=UPI0035CA216C